MRLLSTLEPYGEVSKSISVLIGQDAFINQDLGK